MPPLAPTQPNPVTAPPPDGVRPADETLDHVTTLDHDDRPRVLLADERSSWTGDAVEARVVQLAGHLLDQGVAPGDVVTWTAPPSVGSYVVYRACWRVGAVAAPLHHRLEDDERARLRAQLDPRVDVDLDALPPWPSSGDPDGPHLGDRGARPDDVAVVLFTSGSSGKPKGVLHTHRSLAYKARSMVGVHGLTRDDVVLMPAPLAHVSGLLNGVLVPAAVPMRSVLMARWDPERALELIERHRVSYMVGPPTFFVGLLGAAGFSPERVASVRLLSTGGAGVSPAFVDDAARRLGCRVKRAYGSTEAPTVATWREGDDLNRLATTDGRSTGSAELRVVAPDTFADRPPGQVGELWVRGAELFGGYLDPADNEGAFVDGWFRTGDLAMIDDEGWLTITGRLKELIIRGGENIAPAEVEAVLEAHRDVEQAVVVGEPDERLGERVVAVVVARAPFDLERCRTWFAERGVARHKTPERVVQVDELPLLSSGKPDRRAVAERVRGGSTAG